MLASLLVVLSAGAPEPGPAPGKGEPPARRELFAAEDWYRGRAGKEQAFVGTLRRVERPRGEVGFGRFNPYRLVMGEGPRGVREVYVGAKPELLAPYVGRRVRLTGK